MSEIPFPASAETFNQKPWGGVTNPEMHDPTRFRYLIHLDSGRPVGDPEVGPYEYVLENPELLRTMSTISTSLVDQDHTLLYQGTKSTHGYILEVPASSIIATHSTDMYSQNRDTNTMSSQHPVTDPDQLLLNTEPSDWNEVVIAPEGLVIKAVFWVNNQTGEEPAYDYETVRLAAESSGLPFLELDLKKF